MSKHSSRESRKQRLEQERKAQQRRKRRIRVVGPAHGHVTVLANGKVFTGNPRDVPLTAHAQIQLEVGTPLVAPESISWANTGL